MYSINAFSYPVFDKENIFKFASLPFLQAGRLLQTLVFGDLVLERGSYVLFRRYHPCDGFEKLEKWEKASYLQTCEIVQILKDAKNNFKIVVIGNAFFKELISIS